MAILTKCKITFNSSTSIRYRLLGARPQKKCQTVGIGCETVRVTDCRAETVSFRLLLLWLLLVLLLVYAIDLH